MAAGLLWQGQLTQVRRATGHPSRCLTLVPASVTAATSRAIAACHATCLPGEGRCRGLWRGGHTSPDFPIVPLSPLASGCQLTLDLCLAASQTQLCSKLSGPLGAGGIQGPSLLVSRPS